MENWKIWTKNEKWNQKYIIKKLKKFEWKKLKEMKEYRNVEKI